MGLNNRELLVVCDYYSNFIEVSRLSRVTTSSVVRELKEIFARYGVPDTLVTDNGTQFSSAEFAVFARTWNFDHVTSSPRYPQSNGKAENAVKTVKQLFTKCKQSGQSEFQALLDWRTHRPKERRRVQRSDVWDDVAKRYYQSQAVFSNRATRQNKIRKTYWAGRKTSFLLQPECKDQTVGAD